MHIWLQIGEAFARISMGAILNSLWEGLALAAVAWLLLRTVPRANASLRYALWCLALIGVLALPVIALYASSTPLPATSAEPAVAVPQRFAQVLFALWYVPRFKRARARKAQRRAEARAAVATQPEPGSSDSKTVSSTETPGTSTRS